MRRSNCRHDPDSQTDINEAKVLAAANSFITLGLKDVGYEYGMFVLTKMAYL